MTRTDKTLEWCERADVATRQGQHRVRTHCPTRPIQALLWLACALSPWSAGAFALFATTSGSSPTNPNTLIEVASTNGSQSLVGNVGATTNASAIDFNPLTGVLYGTYWAGTPGLVNTIDTQTGAVTQAAIVRDANLVPVRLSGLAYAADGSAYGATTPGPGNPATIGRIDLDTQRYTPVVTLPAGQFVGGIDVTPAGILFAVAAVLSGPFSQSLLSYDAATFGVLDAIVMGVFNAGDIDYAPDGLIYHSNSSFALIRLDPVTGAQANVGFGTVGGLTGIATPSPIPLPAALWLLFPPVVWLGRRTR